MIFDKDFTMNIWREKLQVRFGDVDRSDRLTLGSIFCFFQEAAISHAADLGVGREALANSGQAWVLSRFSLFVARRPVCGETVQVSTWPRSREKLFALRDYDIRGADDFPLIRGRSCWLILDIEKRRPLRAREVFEKLPPNEGIDAFPAGAAGLGPRENLVKAAERGALYSDIDYFGHVNNARYIQWIQDATDMDVLTAAAQIRFDINYLSEVLPGDTVEILTAAIEEAGTGEDDGSAAVSARDYPRRSGPGFAYEGRRPGSDQAVFRAELRTGG